MTEDRRCSEMAAENKRFSRGFLVAILLSYFGLSILLFPDFISSFVAAVLPNGMAAVVLVCLGVIVLAVSSLVMGRCHQSADERTNNQHLDPAGKKDLVKHQLWY